MGLILIVAAALPVMSDAQPQSWSLSRVIENPSPAETDYFGGKVSVDGDRVLVGSINEGEDCSSTGCVYLFDALTGNQLLTLDVRPDAVSLAGDYALVGEDYYCFGLDDCPGRAFLFDTVSGNLLRTLENPSPDDGDYFGMAVSVSGNRVLIGAPGDDSTGMDAGRAYLFDAVSGSLLHTFENPAPDEGWVLRLFNNDDTARAYLNGEEILSCGYGEYCQKAFSSRLHRGANELRIEVTNTGGGWTYGYEVTLDGAVFAADQCGTAGVAGCQDNDTTIGIVLDETIAISNFNVQDQFGSSVSIAGDRVLIGAWGDDSTNPESGRAYLFDAVSGSLVHTFENPASNIDYGAFGLSVSIAGDRVLVGAPFAWNYSAGVTAGYAYLFDAVSGELLHTLENPSPDEIDLFGQGVDVYGDRLLIGAPLDDSAGTNSGRAYMFDAASGNLLQVFENPRPGAEGAGDPDQFGWEVSMDGDRVAISAAQDDIYARNSGRVYLYGPDNQPDPFTFIDQTNVQIFPLITSNTVTITGIEVPSPISVVGGEYSINCTSAFVSTPGIISNGQTVCVRHINDPVTGSSTVLTVGGVADTFSSTVDSVVDTTPDSFSFSSAYLGNDPAQTLNIVYTTEPATITGINVPTPISVAVTDASLQPGTQYDASSSVAYSIGCYDDGEGDQTSEPGLIRNGETVCVSVLTPDIKPYYLEITVTIGDTQATFTLEAQVFYDAVDTEPDFFSFADQSGVMPSSLVTSAPVVVAGFDGQLLVSIPNGVGEYSIGCTGSFVTGGGYIESGQSLCVRHVSASTPASTSVTRVKIGAVASQFTSTTWAAAAAVDSDGDGIPDAQDNCINAANGPAIPDAGGNSQWDADGDGYGNRCDGDLNNNGFTNAQDYVLFRAQLGQPSVYPAFKSADINGNGFANAQDYVLFRQLLGSPPGPSGVAP